MSKKQQILNSFQVDIYSAGVILFELLVPSVTDNDGRTTRKNPADQVANNTWRNVDLLADVSNETRTMLNACLHRDPTKRPTSDQLCTFVKTNWKEKDE